MRELGGEPFDAAFNDRSGASRRAARSSLP
jgi:hypothetical protein